VAVGQEKIGCVNEDVIKAFGAFGGGFAGTGKTCGILAGGMAVLSTIYSRGNLEDKENPKMWHAGQKLVRKFEELTVSHGGVDCQDIAQVDWTDRDAARDYYKSQDGRRQICFTLIGDFAYAVGELLDEIKAE
jgi:C_GCAxxG_C_C family probable redox protein